MNKRLLFFILMIVLMIITLPQVVNSLDKFKMNNLKNKAIQIAINADKYFLEENKLDGYNLIDNIECVKIVNLNNKYNCHIVNDNGLAVIELQLNRFICIGTQYNMNCAKNNKNTEKNAANFIIGLCSDSCKEGITDDNGLFKDEHGDYRYAGSNPNNYALFNGEIWRVIGVFDKRIKLIRNDSLGNFPFDKGISHTNIWNLSDISLALNGDYLINTKWNELHLSSDSQKIIGDAVWYLSGYDSVDGNRDNIYRLERFNVYDKWIGKVGLMYISDYLYASDDCYNSKYKCEQSNWLFDENFQWTISPYSKHIGYTWVIDSNGDIKNSYGVDNSFSIRPALYLLPSVHVTGSGTVTSPFQFDI